jgi:hypothetical protein
VLYTTVCILVLLYELFRQIWLVCCLLCSTICQCSRINTIAMLAKPTLEKSTPLMVICYLWYFTAL